MKRTPNLRKRPTEQPVLFDSDEDPPGAYGSRPVQEPGGWNRYSIPPAAGPDPRAADLAAETEPGNA